MLMYKTKIQTFNHFMQWMPRGPLNM